MSSQSEVYSSHPRVFYELLIRLRSELSNVLDNVLILAVTAERHPATIRTLEDPAEPAAAPPRRANDALGGDPRLRPAHGAAGLELRSPRAEVSLALKIVRSGWPWSGVDVGQTFDCPATS